MSNQESLAQRVQSCYQQLSVVAADLNKVSDELGQSIAELDAALKKLNLGISAWVTIRSWSDEIEGGYWSEDLCYTKVGGKWGIALRNVSGNHQWPEGELVEEWLFNDAPRAQRLLAIGCIPALLEKLTKEATESTQKIKAKLAEVKEVASAVKAAAEKPNRASQKPEVAK